MFQFRPFPMLPAQYMNMLPCILSASLNELMVSKPVIFGQSFVVVQVYQCRRFDVAHVDGRIHGQCHVNEQL
jgi:hypothetical protein